MNLLDSAKSKPAPHSSEELEKLVSLVRSINDFSQMNPDEQDILIATLSDYECYGQVIKLLEWRVQSPGRNADDTLSDYCLLMTICYEGLESFEDFCVVAETCVEKLSLPFTTIRLHIADDILGPDNFEEHAKLYRRLNGVVADKAQQVLMLCRLALIVEKKLYQESEAEPIYRSILQIDPMNIKALRFFRLWFGQTGEWEKAAKQLHNLIKAYKNPHEKTRAAHELAQIFLYNLNQPEKAIQALRTHCQDSRLDSRQTLVEALDRLGSYEELIETLENIEKSTNLSDEKAAVLQRQGLVYEKMGLSEKAESVLKKSLQLDATNLLTHEALVTSLINQNNQTAVQAAILKMNEFTKTPECRQKLQSLADSL